MSVKWGARRPAKREGPTRRPRVQPLRVWGRRVCGQLGVGRGQEGMWGTDVSRERVRSEVLESWMHLHARKMVWVSLINEFFFCLFLLWTAQPPTLSHHGSWATSCSTATKIYPRGREMTIHTPLGAVPIRIYCSHPKRKTIIEARLVTTTVVRKDK